MGYMRQLKPGQKAEVRAIKEKKGVEAAIKRAQRLAQR
jgi:cold shock CspA family protein